MVEFLKVPRLLMSAQKYLEHTSVTDWNTNWFCRSDWHLILYWAEHHNWVIDELNPKLTGKETDDDRVMSN